MAGTGVLRIVILVSMLAIALARYQHGDDDAVYRLFSNNGEASSSSQLVRSNTNDNAVVPNWGYRNSEYCIAKCIFECLVTFWQLSCTPECFLKCKVTPLPPPTPPKAPLLD